MDCEEHEDERKEDQRNHSGGSTETTKQQPTTKKPTVNYRECQKNHAVNIGGHAVDGCCEFIPAGEGGTLEALKCAACNCHRNFHRKETDHGGDTHHHYQTPQFAPYYNYRPPPPSGYFHLTPPQQFRPLALPETASGEEDVSNNPSSNERGYGGGSGGFSISKKRVRTKFTNEQKEKMLGFAETIGWRLQGQDESEISRFCQEIGVTRHVLKVWMHNNKNTLGKKP